jgi:ribosomal protein S18 acetylase RimI-like enzyme
VENYQERYQEDAAGLITAAYQGHVDSHINDQYRTLAGARRFVQNVVQYPGCGTFQGEASLLAWRRDTGRLCGMVLASTVASGTGHITQVCVSPEVRGHGVGYELMAHALRALAAHGCRKVSLTVTSSNRGAIRLYEQMGFTTRRTFPALVWDELRPSRRFF